MSDWANGTEGVPRIEQLSARNFRALRDLTLRDMTPLTVLVGPNGSGKSTVFDVFAFLSECFTDGLRRAWDKRGRFRELRSRGAGDEPITIELTFRERPESTPMAYRLSIGESADGPFVAEERLDFTVSGSSKPVTQLMDFRNGSGRAWLGGAPSEGGKFEEIALSSPDTLAVSSLGQLKDHPRALALRKFITGWYLSHLTADAARSVPEAGPRERLSASGDNLANVMQYLGERHPEVTERMLSALTARVPRLQSVEAKMEDGRLLLQIKDAPFERPILARYASDGTLKMLSYLVVLHDPDPPPLIGIEEPENHLHPRLLPELAEECRLATERSQLLVTTHSPFFLDGLIPEQVWVLHRDEQGYAQAMRAADMELVPRMMEAGASLGNLWTEGYFDVGDPLTNAGGSRVITVGEGR